MGHEGAVGHVLLGMYDMAAMVHSCLLYTLEGLVCRPVQHPISWVATPELGDETLRLKNIPKRGCNEKPRNGSLYGNLPVPTVCQQPDPLLLNCWPRPLRCCSALCASTHMIRPRTHGGGGGASWWYMRFAGFTILVQLGPRVSEVVAYTTRVGELLEALDKLAPPASPTAPGPAPPPHEDRADLLARSASVASDESHVESTGSHVPLYNRDACAHDDAGAVAPHIAAKGLQVALPTGETLTNLVSFAVQPRDRLLIIGPAGCGKTSLLRILRGLWPVTKGELQRPPDSQIVFLPQVSPPPETSLCSSLGTAESMARLGAMGPRRGKAR